MGIGDGGRARTGDDGRTRIGDRDRAPIGEGGRLGDDTRRPGDKERFGE